MFDVQNRNKHVHKFRLTVLPLNPFIVLFCKHMDTLYIKRVMEEVHPKYLEGRVLLLFASPLH